MSTADAETVMGDTGVIYVCAECGEPVESEPCREHQSVAFLAGELAWAIPGNRCKVPGFTDWVCTPFNGWQQDETGWMVTHGLLAQMIIDSGYQLTKPEGSDRADLNSLPAAPDPLSVGNTAVAVLTHPGGSALNDGLDSERFGVLDGAHASILAHPKPEGSES